MKILLAHNRYQQAGGEDQVVRTEAAMLTQHGHEVQQVLFDNDRIQGITAQILAAAGSLFNPAAYQRVQQAIKAFQPDVLHVHNFLPGLSPAVFFAGRRNDVPVVQTLHNYRLLCASGTLYHDGQPCERCLDRRSFLPGVVRGCYRGSHIGSAVVGSTMALHAALGTWHHRVDRFIALTDFAAAKLSQHRIPADRIRVKPNFVPDRGMGSGEDEVALFVGRLSEEKGILTLLAADAAHSLPLPVMIIGDGPLRERVQQACARPGSRLTALGQQKSEQVIERMKRAAVLLVPSVCYEGFPVTVVEALSAGLPVIASGHGSLREIVSEGQCGFLHTPGDPAALVQALRTFCAMSAEQRLQMRITSRKSYRSHFNEAVNYAQLMQIYAEAIASSAEQQERPLPDAIDSLVLSEEATTEA